MRFSSAGVAIAVGLFAASCARQSAPAAPVAAPAPARPAVAQLDVRVLADSADVAFLIDEGTHRSHVPADLRHLTDVIGPRLTGSAGMRRANEWTAAKLAEYGADSVWLDPWPFGVQWQRGPASMRLLSPHERWVNVVSWAWAPGTNGPRAGPVVFVDALDRADFDRRFGGRLAGAWVMTTKPYPRTYPNPDVADSLRVDSLRRELRERNQRLTQPQRSFLAQLPGLLAQAGVAGRIVDGGKDFALMTMSGSPDDIAPFPMVVVGNQTFAELHRDIAAGDSVRVEVNVSNTLGRDTLVQWNTIGEIRGSELPNEVVLLGAHLDSWDLGTGATDNAAGSIAVLEAARILGALKAHGVRPRRTIRFALFSGEEQGLYGSQYYTLRHAPELPRHQAVIVLDNGSGRIVALPLQGQDRLFDLWTSMMRPLESLGPIPVRSGRKTGTDHLAFEPAGVPDFNYDQMSRGYDYTHHSQVDVFDYTVPGDVVQAATVMAVNAFQLANLDRLLPRTR